MVERHRDESLGTLVVRLVDDAKAYARAEVGVWKAVASARSSDAVMAIAFGAGAVAFALAALTALLVGLILLLRLWIGIGGATAVVVVAALLLAGVLGMMAQSRFRKVTSGDGL